MMDTDFMDETGHQIPVEFEKRSVISALFRPFKALNRAVRS